MIRRILFCTLAMVGLYAALLGLPGMHGRVEVQSLWQDNIVRYQSFLARATPKVVIVGTSLVRPLRSEAVAEECYNLAVAGGNVIPTLQLIASQEQLPRVVIVEATMIMQNGAAGLIENATRPVFVDLRKLTPVFREQYAPANLGAWFSTRWLVMPALSWTGIPHFEERPRPTRMDAPLFDATVRREVESRNALFRQQELDTACRTLKSSVDTLIAKGVRVVLIDFPHHPAVMATPRDKQLRAAISLTLPDSSYEWLHPDPLHAYETTDAIHLAEPESRALEARLKAHLAGF